jgi:hypothetical protein
MLDERGRGAVQALRRGERHPPLFRPRVIVAEQTERAKIDIKARGIGEGRGSGGAAGCVDLLKRNHRRLHLPKRCAARSVEGTCHEPPILDAGEENPSIRENRGRESMRDRSFPRCALPSHRRTRCAGDARAAGAAELIPREFAGKRRGEPKQKDESGGALDRNHK